MIVCESERLLIRHMTSDDAEFLFRQVNQPSWIQNIGNRGVRNLHQAENYIDAVILAQYSAHGYGMNVCQLKSGHKSIGVCGLVKRDILAHPDLGFALLEEFWGQGYAFEAAQAVMRHARTALGIDRLLAINMPSNVRSAMLLNRLGFEISGMVRLTPDGEELRLYTT